MPNFFETLKVSLTFFLALLISAGYLSLTGACYVYHQIVRILAIALRHKKLSIMLQGLDRHMVECEPDIKNYPKGNVTSFLLVEGFVPLEDIQQHIYEKVVNFKDKDGNLVYEKLQQYPRPWLGYLFLQNEKEFDIKVHVKYSHEITESNLNPFICLNRDAAFETKRSMWEILVGHNFDADGNTGIYCRFHHSITDGLRVLELFRSQISDTKPIQIVTQNPPCLSALPKLVPTKSNIWAEIVSTPRRMMLEAASERYLSLPDCKPSAKFYARTTSGIDVEGLKRAKQKLGVSLTVLMISAVSTALEAFFAEYVDDPRISKMDYLTAMITLPLSGAGTNKLTNHFTFGTFKMPLAENSKPMESRMNTITAEMKGMLDSAKGRIMAFIFRFGQQLPSLLYRKLIVKTKPGSFPGINLTNVPGSSEASTFLNHRVLDMMFWTSLDVAWISFSILSYNGKLKVGCMGHANIISSQDGLDSICKRIEIELKTSIAYASKLE